MIGHASPIEHLAFGVGAGAAIFVYGVVWLGRRDRSRLRMASWSSGVVAVVVATLPIMERWSQRTFTGHMVQHLLLIAVAAPLLVAAEPVRLLTSRFPLRGRRARWERRAGRWWRAYGPIVGVASFVVVLYLTHLTSLYDDALSNRVLHDLEHAAYLLSAVLVWSTVRSGRRLQAPLRIAAVFAVIAASALLGVVLITASEPLVATYADRLGRRTALADQRRAASLMWVGGMSTTLPLLILSVWSWATAEQRAAERAESIRDAPPA